MRAEGICFHKKLICIIKLIEFPPLFRFSTRERGEGSVRLDREGKEYRVCMEGNARKQKKERED